MHIAWEFRGVSVSACLHACMHVCLCDTTSAASRWNYWNLSPPNALPPKADPACPNAGAVDPNKPPPVAPNAGELPAPNTGEEEAPNGDVVAPKDGEAPNAGVAVAPNADAEVAPKAPVAPKAGWLACPKVEVPKGFVCPGVVLPKPKPAGFCCPKRDVPATKGWEDDGKHYCFLGRYTPAVRYRYR